MSDINHSSSWYLEWTDELSVFNAKIDAEHQHFISLVNELNKAIFTNMELDTIKKCMADVLDDAESHFASEEDFFKQWIYPAAAEHAQIHNRIIEALRYFMTMFGHEDTKNTWKVVGNNIKLLLVDHLFNEDMKYRDFNLKNNQSKFKIQ
jgi:hemerythrin